MITTEAKAFLAAMKDSLVLAAKQTIPVLGCVRVTNNTMTATDLDNMTIVKFAANGKGDFLLPYRQTIDVLSGESGTLTIEGKEAKNVKDRPSVKLKVNGCEYSFATMNISNFPKSLQPDKPTLVVDEDEFSTMVGRVIFAISNEQSRYTLHGALLKAEKGAITMVATDGHRLSRALGNGKGNLKQTLVSRSALGWLKNNVDAPVGIGLSEDDQYQTFVIGDKTMIARKLSGNFPDYNAVIPKSVAATASFGSSKTLLATLGRVAKCADERSLLTRWHFYDKKVSAKCDRGYAEASIDCDMDVPPTGGAAETLGVCVTYIQDFLKVIGDVPFTIGVTDLASPLFLKVDQFDYILMPMKI